MLSLLTGKRRVSEPESQYSKRAYAEMKTRVDRANAALPQLVTRFRRPEFDGTVLNVKSHFALPLMGPHVFVDAKYCLLLCTGEQYLAVVSFLHDAPRATITQLQAGRRNQAHLRGLRWEHLLVELLAAAVKGEFSQLAITPAEEIGWYIAPLNRLSYTKERMDAHQACMRMRYNVTAKRLGFRYNAGQKLFIRDLP